MYCLFLYLVFWEREEGRRTEDEVERSEGGRAKKDSMLKHNFRQLKIWVDSVKLARQVYVLTQTFPNEHKFGLSSQLYWSAVSISSNIAERTARNSQKGSSHFLKISLDSAFELETQLIIGHDCLLINTPGSNPLIEVIQAYTEANRKLSNS